MTSAVCNVCELMRKRKSYNEDLDRSRAKAKASAQKRKQSDPARWARMDKIRHQRMFAKDPERHRRLACERTMRYYWKKKARESGNSSMSDTDDT